MDQKPVTCPHYEKVLSPSKVVISVQSRSGAVCRRALALRYTLPSKMTRVGSGKRRLHRPVFLGDSTWRNTLPAEYPVCGTCRGDDDAPGAGESSAIAIRMLKKFSPGLQWWFYADPLQGHTASIRREIDLYRRIDCRAAESRSYLQQAAFADLFSACLCC
jgi:hypothetical protein